MNVNVAHVDQRPSTATFSPWDTRQSKHFAPIEEQTNRGRHFEM